MSLFMIHSDLQIQVLLVWIGVMNIQMNKHVIIIAVQSQRLLSA